MAVELHRSKHTAENEIGIVYLIHGFADHVERYEHFKDHLATHNISFQGHDQRGHGKTTVGTRAYIEDFDIFVNDTIVELEAIKKEKPDVPVVAVGHSMGGLITIRIALKRPDLLAGILLSAPLLKLSDGVSPFMRKIAWGMGYVAPTLYMPWNSLDRDKLTPNMEYRNKDAADPNIWHYGCRAGMAVEMFKAIDATKVERETLSVKTVIFHSNEDGVCDISGSKELAELKPDVVTLVEISDLPYHSLLHLMPEDTKKMMDDIVVKLKELFHKE